MTNHTPHENDIWGLLAGLLVVGFILPMPGQAQPKYTVTDLGTLGGFTVPLSVNDQGEVTGYSEVGGNPHGFRYSNGTLTDLGTLGGVQSFGLGINLSGQVVGQSQLGSGGQHAFIYSNGAMSDLTPTVPRNTAAAAINDAGQVTGFLDTGTALRPFLYSAGVVSVLPSFGGNYAQGQGINSAGQVVGYSELADNMTFHAFLYANATMEDLGTLGGAHSFATAINSIRQIVGYSTPSWTSSYHAFLDSSGVMTDLGTLGGLASEALAINDAGRVVGRSDAPSGQSAFLYEGGIMKDLNSLVSLNVRLLTGYGINNSGHIAALGAGGHAYLLTPIIDTTPPVITPSVTGTLGLNGWYTSSATVNWSISDPESGITSSSGCTTINLTVETAGVTLTCSATNGAGLSASTPVTIKIDKTPPVIAGMPAMGCALWPVDKKLDLVATVTASDARSGLASGGLKVTAMSTEPIAPTNSRYPDIVIMPTGSGGYTVQLQADRFGTATDRTYALRAVASDLAGNLSTLTATCTVPHDQGN